MISLERKWQNDKALLKKEFEKWRTIRASVVGVGGVGGVLVWVAWVVCFSGWHASVGGVTGIFAWVAC